MPGVKKLFLILIIAIAVFSVFLIRQIWQYKNITVDTNPVALVSLQSVEIPVDQSDPQLGNPGAPLTIVEFSALDCRQCQKMHYVLENFVNKNPTKTRLIWKSVPRGSFIFKADTLPYRAAVCAGAQNKFWPFVNLCMQSSSNLREQGLKKSADGLKLNTTVWWTCVGSPDAERKVQTDLDLAAQLGVKTLPAIFINNQAVNPQDESDIEKILEKITQP